MAAAEITETLVGGTLAPYLGLKMATYTVTVVTQNDWVIFGDFTAVKQVYCTINATGALNPCTIDGTTLNKVVLTSATTGAMTITVWGL
jgi:hypothetical protein